MSLEAGRVGVRNDQVDAYGRINPNDFLIDDIIRDLPGWTDMPVWRGGIEAILPENDDEPETSPILADIQYPDALRNNQYFTYRESPTAVDGKAKIRRIQGNTLVFNQLVQNGNFANTSGWSTIADATNFSVSDNIASFDFPVSTANPRIQTTVNIIANHKYYYAGEVYNPNAINVELFLISNYIRFGQNNSFERKSAIFTALNTQAYSIGPRAIAPSVSGTLQAKNIIVIDLTTMFGSGNEPTAEEFESLFSLAYYAYTPGKLLPFKGEELRTANADETETNDLSLPTLDFFPTGMKSAGSVYDELLPDKAITRIGSIDLGTITWTNPSTTGFHQCNEFDFKPCSNNSVANIICSLFVSDTALRVYQQVQDNSIGINEQGKVSFYSSSILPSDLSDVYLYYELIEPIIEPTIIIE